MAKKRILIVEDEHLVAEQLKQGLTSQGYDVVGVVHSGEQAVRIGGESSPDLVVMDIMLSGSMDGISAAQQLHPLGIPVVYLTGYSDRHLLERAQHTEPLGYLMKPAQASEIGAVIHLALHRQERERRRQRAGETALSAESEAIQQFRLMVAGVTDYAIFTLDAAGRVNSWNPGAERITGYTKQQIFGEDFAILFTEEDRQRNLPELELQTARTAGVADDTCWLVRRNGERYWAEGTLTAIKDDAGTITGFAKITRDATDRKRMQEALEASEQRLRIALHAARVGTWHWNIKADTDTLDPSLCELFGLRPEQTPANIRDFFALLHPDDRPRVEAAFEKTRLEGAHLNTEFRVRQPDGSDRWFMDQGEVAHDAAGQPDYMSGACVDITERKQAEEALRRSEERFRLFVDNVSDYALFQTDVDGHITSWNSGAERVLGLTAEEAIGQPTAILFVPEDVAAGIPEREFQTASTLGRAYDERWHLRADGSRFWCNGVMTVMRDDQQRVRGFAKVMRDETDRRHTQEQLQASLQEKEVLLKEIHHRVKNNLQVITSLLALQSGTVQDQAVRQMFDEAGNRVRSIGEIHELLYRSPDLAHVDFHTYLDRLAHHLLSFYGVDPNRIKVGITTTVGVPLLQAIPCGLVVNELLTNCLKHAYPEGKSGTIRISLHCASDRCVLEVADDGVGMPSTFDLDRATSLGLKLVAVLARQLGGELRVQGRPGTHVSVLFPQDDRIAPEQPA